MRLLLIITLFAVLYASGCSSEQKKSGENIAVIEKYIRAVENLDYQTMADLLDDDYYGYGPSYNDSIAKDQALKSWKHNAESLYKSIRYTKSRNVAVSIPSGPNKGDWVSNWGELNIEYKNGKKVTIWANTIYKIDNGKIVKSYTFYNEADVLKQLGYVFINPEDL
jgi:hypothetical protein